MDPGESKGRLPLFVDGLSGNDKTTTSVGQTKHEDTCPRHPRTIERIFN